MLRRSFLATPAALAAAGTAPDNDRPLFNLHRFSQSPVKVAGIECLQHGKSYLVRAISSSGATGLILAKDPFREYFSLMREVVIPFFIGRDARDLESLVDLIYIKNYKMSGQPFVSPSTRLLAKLENDT